MDILTPILKKLLWEPFFPLCFHNFINFAKLFVPSKGYNFFTRSSDSSNLRTRG